MNKHAQIATTATWVAGTLVILIILGIFLFVTSSLSGVKQLTPNQISSSNVDPKTSDLFLSKSFSAYLLSEEKGKTMYVYIKNENNVEETSGDVAKKTFLFIYPDVYLLLQNKSASGLVSEGFVKNDYFNYLGHIYSRKGSPFNDLPGPAYVESFFYLDLEKEVSALLATSLYYV